MNHKRNSMKQNATQQEILLLTTSRFSQREWCEKENNEQNFHSSAERLQDACWNGILDEMLPEIVEKSSTGKKLFLWHVRHCNAFLEIELSDASPVIDPGFSIDPYFFIPHTFLN